MRRIFSGQMMVHVIAAGLALFYAWHVSQSVFVTTGLQFVTPLIIIMVVHLSWIAVTTGLVAGFSSHVYWRSAQSGVGMAAVILVSSILAPKPAQAAVGEFVEGALVVVFCVAIIAVVAGLLASIVYLFFKLLALPFKGSDDDDADGPQSRLFDFGSLALAGVFLTVCSLEGVTSALSFAPDHRSEATYIVDATPDQVWATMEQATSPDFPLPNILGMFPQPVDVATDEGTALGALRRVEFQGREGAGALTLRVIERTNQRAVFEVQSDTSPYANWVAHRQLTYNVVPAGEGTRITVSLDYDRRLAPAWFFTPATKGAAYLAMDVLARDVKSRAEAATH